MPMETPHRRKSRIGPGLLLKQSLGAGGATDGSHALFIPIRNEPDGNLLRRSVRHQPQEASSGAGSSTDQQDASLTPFQSISKELDDPIDQLSAAADQLVEKMAVVADIHAGLAHFNESFGAFLYGLKMNADNIEWPEAPTKRSFERMEQREAEAVMIQQQQEELERIRRQQILEQEMDRERQRLETERLEAERIKASLSSLHSASVNSIQDGNRQRRGITANARGRGVAPSKIPARPNASNAAASRVGPGGAVRKLVGKVVMKRMADRLPLRYRDEPHRTPIETIMRSLSEHIEGQGLPELAAVSNVPRHRCNEYLGVLIHAKEVIRNNQKGVLFSLNPERYPSR
ncbi:hypothetical protein BGZ98_000267 [Dissophora globulifera]|nr:hypothetical protein BGZ98_000267 [Dissophora globulifera]